VRLVTATVIFGLAMGAGLALAPRREGSPSVPKSGSPAVRTSAKSGQSGSAASGKAAGSRTTPAKAARTRNKASSTSRARPRLPQAPTPERYLEIQQALIERGYLGGPATGKWGPECAEALKRFQQDHNLEATGKLNALTLIALGLGPNRSLLVPSAAPADGGRQSEEKPQ
jgi:peptidoglycan hydrolase-like protein with peptidoglycan-binding domain